jgi:hypothetical protein
MSEIRRKPTDRQDTRSPDELETSESKPRSSPANNALPSVPHLLAILKESIEKVPANIYAFGVIGIVAAASVATILAGGNWLVAVGSGVVMLAGMVILRIFAASAGTPVKPKLTVHAQVLTWICLSAFAVVLALLVGRFFFALFPYSNNLQTTSQNPQANLPSKTDLPSKSKEPQPETKASEETPGESHPVPVKIVVVQSHTLIPVDHTILTVRSSDGVYVQQELIPKRGVANVLLRPGRYRLGAIGALGELQFEVSPPQTEITIQIDLNKELSYADSGQHLFETVEIGADTSKWAMNDRVHLSVIGIDFEGSPLRHRVTFSVGGPSTATRTYEKKDVGTVVKFRRFEIRVTAIDTFKAQFAVSRATSNTL